MEPSLTTFRDQFSEILDLDRPVPEEAFIAALQNESYARNLLLNKEFPETLEKLLRNPQRPGLGSREISAGELIGKAAKALLRWGQTGFTMAGKEVIIRREEACLACPQLRDPKGILQNMVPAAAQNDNPGRRTGRKVCGICGCNVSNKIQMPTESCPDEHPDHSGMTRWMEIMSNFDA